MKLNIGAGDVPLDGYTPIDRKLGQEAYPLAFDDNSVDEVRASHILEHFGAAELIPVVKEWVRVLKPGGLLKIAVPDMAKIVAYINQGRTDLPLGGYIYGGQTDANDFHKSGFTAHDLENLLRHCGLRFVHPWTSDAKDCAALPVSLNLAGYKPDPARKPTVRGVMSMPRLAFTSNMHAAMSLISARHLPITTHTGAFWDQCMERGIEMELENKSDYILTIDYDTAYTTADFDALLEILEHNPHIDAVAPMQVKRDENAPLANVLGDDGKPLPPNTPVHKSGVYDRPYMLATWAHFGFTLFRRSAFERVSKPWFWGQPSPASDWGDGRIDPDIYFWNKFKAQGLTLAVTARVCVGHDQKLITWPTRDGQIIHQYGGEFLKTGKPEEAK